MTPIKILLRFVIMIFGVIALEYYAFEAVKTLAVNFPPELQLWLEILYWSVPAAVILTVLLFIQRGNQLRRNPTFVYWRTFLMCIYLLKLLIVPFMLLDDFRRIIMLLFTDVSPITRSYGLALAGLLFALIPFSALIYGMIRNPFRYKIFRERIGLEDLPGSLDGLRIVHISDLHSGSFLKTQPLIRIVNLINGLEPDLVFFTGDLVNSVASEMDGLKEVLARIRSKYGIYSILGNHDYGDYVLWPSADAKRRNFDNLISTHNFMGWDLLRNENRVLEINGEKLAIIGVENYSAKPHFQRYGRLDVAYAGTESIALKLLLSHDPSHWDFEINQKFKDIDVTFSGHTHGFQFGIEIPGLIKWSPFQRMYKQWAGLYKKGKQYLYVTRGLGFLGYPGRVGMLPEISMITLRKHKNE